jgi:hypothetical protein
VCGRSPLVWIRRVSPSDFAAFGTRFRRQGVYTIPMFVSDQATDMVMRLLQHDPNKRLGRVGRDEVRPRTQSDNARSCMRAVI